MQFLPRGGGPEVAIIGAGPAGLAAAHDLTVAGAQVTLFDRDDHPGGLLRDCIPDFRLPPEVAQADIRRILSLGIRFEPGFRLESEEQLRALRDQGYAAVLLATGAGDDREPGVPGWRTAPVSRTAIAFLRDVARGRARLDGKRVVVVGGGNGAIDSARTALRVGASEVAILYRRGREHLPAFGDEIAAAESEGIRIHPWMGVNELVWKADTLEGVRCVRTRLEDGDAPPRERRVEEVAESGHFRSCDAVVFSIGQSPTSMPPLSRVPGVFAHRAPSAGGGTVVEAIAAGREAAVAIVSWLARSGRWSGERPARAPAEGGPPGAPESIGETPERPESFSVLPFAVVPGEAGRCLRCDLSLTLDAERCVLCGGCETRCAHGALAWRQIVNGASRLTVHDDLCMRCGDCVAGCPSRALRWELWIRPNRFQTVWTTPGP
jgi:NADPH-dependent glutamate synthase beta subunit-like oxidoreductase